VSARRLTRRQRLARTVTVTAALLCSGVVAAVVGHDTPAPADVPTAQLGAASTPTTHAAVKAAPAETALDPAAFAAGSCVAFVPTHGDRHLTVFLDAGHGGPDPGGQGSTLAGRAIDERSLTLPVVLDTTALLRADGFRVVDSRTTDGPVVRTIPTDLHGLLFSLSGKHRDTAARAQCADLAGASALVSVHFNIGATRSNAGTETTYDAVRPFAPRSLALANLLQADLVAGLHAVPGWNVPDDGVVTDSQMGNALSSQGAAYGHLLLLGPASAPYFTTPSVMPGALTEPLFLTDPFEGTVAASIRGQQVIAAAIAKAVTTFLAP
jgi:N-acetylmuramoyl-L-alanine amidase